MWVPTLFILPSQFFACLACLLILYIKIQYYMCGVLPTQICGLSYLKILLFIVSHLCMIIYKCQKLIFKHNFIFFEESQRSPRIRVKVFEEQGYELKVYNDILLSDNFHNDIQLSDHLHNRKISVIKQFNNIQNIAIKFRNM